MNDESSFKVQPSLQSFFLVCLPDRLILQCSKEKQCLSLSDSGDCLANSLKLEVTSSPQYAPDVIARRIFGVIG